MGEAGQARLKIGRPRRRAGTSRRAASARSVDRRSRALTLRLLPGEEVVDAEDVGVLRPGGARRGASPGSPRRPVTRTRLFESAMCSGPRPSGRGSGPSSSPEQSSPSSTSSSWSMWSSSSSSTSPIRSSTASVSARPGRRGHLDEPRVLGDVSRIHHRFGVFPSLDRPRISRSAASSFRRAGAARRRVGSTASCSSVGGAPSRCAESHGPPP